MDLISVHALGGKTLVFANTKAQCDAVSDALNEATASEALHGDVVQSQREASLAKFRCVCDVPEATLISERCVRPSFSESQADNMRPPHFHSPHRNPPTLGK